MPAVIHVTHYKRSDSNPHLADGTWYGQRGMMFLASRGSFCRMHDRVYFLYKGRWIGPFIKRDVSGSNVADLPWGVHPELEGRRPYKIVHDRHPYHYSNGKAKRRSK